VLVILLSSTVAESRETHSLTPSFDTNLLLTVCATGLFAPRQGQAYREEQRRRRSQFDRGTPGADFELQYGFVPGLVDGYQHFADPAALAYAPNHPAYPPLHTPF
jgi:hypothetical protein